jgi:hypothetical protein
LQREAIKLVAALPGGGGGEGWRGLPATPPRRPQPCYPRVGGWESERAERQMYSQWHGRPAPPSPPTPQHTVSCQFTASSSWQKGPHLTYLNWQLMRHSNSCSISYHLFKYLLIFFIILSFVSISAHPFQYLLNRFYICSFCSLVLIFSHPFQYPLVQFIICSSASISAHPFQYLLIR